MRSHRLALGLLIFQGKMDAGLPLLGKKLWKMKKEIQVRGKSGVTGSRYIKYTSTALQ